MSLLRMHDFFPKELNFNFDLYFVVLIVQKLSYELTKFYLSKLFMCKLFKITFEMEIS